MKKFALLATSRGHIRASAQWHGIGADAMKRIAGPTVGGFVTSFLLEVTLYPTIFAIWKGRKLCDAERPSTADASAIAHTAG